MGRARTLSRGRDIRLGPVICLRPRETYDSAPAIHLPPLARLVIDQELQGVELRSLRSGRSTSGADGRELGIVPQRSDGNQDFAFELSGNLRSSQTLRLPDNRRISPAAPA
jgi:hypothetical protein